MNFGFLDKVYFEAQKIAKENEVALAKRGDLAQIISGNVAKDRATVGATALGLGGFTALIGMGVVNAAASTAAAGSAIASVAAGLAAVGSVAVAGSAVPVVAVAALGAAAVGAVGMVASQAIGTNWAKGIQVERDVAAGKLSNVVGPTVGNWLTSVKRVLFSQDNITQNQKMTEPPSMGGGFLSQQAKRASLENSPAKLRF
jgi:hypothetical protein